MTRRRARMRTLPYTWWVLILLVYRVCQCLQLSLQLQLLYWLDSEDVEAKLVHRISCQVPGGKHFFLGRTSYWWIMPSNDVDVDVHHDTTQVKLESHPEGWLRRRQFQLDAFLQRNIHQCPRETKVLCYKTLLRPVIEYASIIWDPHTNANM